MGREIDRDEFDAADFRRFGERLQRGLAALGELLQRPGFGGGPPSLGAELELCLVDAKARPLLRNLEVLEHAGDSRITVELNRFNLECNTAPVQLSGRPFTALAQELENVLAEVRRGAATQGGRVATIGILPTLRSEDVQAGAMTDTPRFRALSASLRRLRRHARFEVEIDGPDSLRMSCDDVTFEGANTAFQLHLGVEPGQFAHLYNAAQMATAPVLAAAGNSPFFLGHRLWEETRVALFKQAVDERDEISEAWRPARVSFGHGWLRESALELFTESVALHHPLLPVVGDQDPLECVRAGGVPTLDEVRLHHGTVWRWNRAIYDPRGGGHLRIELRTLPSGPSVVDMIANAALFVGLAFGLVREIGWMTTALPFGHAERNFYRAAQNGLEAMLLWPSRDPPSPQPIRAGELVRSLLPLARRGLQWAGVDLDEGDPLLAVIEERVASGVTGSAWQRRILASLERRMSRDEALAALLERYLAGAESGLPVHRWPLET